MRDGAQRSTLKAFLVMSAQELEARVLARQQYCSLLMTLRTGRHKVGISAVGTTSHDQITNTFPLHICILQVIKEPGGGNGLGTTLSIQVIHAITCL